MIGQYTAYRLIDCRFINDCIAADCTALLIQQNDGSGLMNRSWTEYKAGFGDPSGNYWLGNDLLSQLTANNRYKLRFDLQQRYSGNWYYAEYSTFIVQSEADNYTLQVNGFSGNVSYDAFGRWQWHNGSQFSTIDRDNDLWPYRNCAAWRGGGFWWRWDCGLCFVNGARSTGYFYWDDLPGGPRNLQLSRMWLQCKQ